MPKHPFPPARSRLAPLAIAAILCLLLALFLVFTLPGVTPPARAAEIDPAIYAALEAAPDGQATFILYLHDQADLSGAENIADWKERGRYVYNQLHAAAQESQTRLQALEASDAVPGRISGFKPLWIANAIVVRGDRQALEALARQPEVARVLPEMKFNPPPTPEATVESQAAETVGWGVDKIGAPVVWAPPYNARGQGIVVGIIDTGVQWDHPALKLQYRGWDAGAATVNHDYNWYNPRPDKTCNDTLSGTCDWYGHGTHVTGIVAGDVVFGTQVGVAPGAKWIQALGCCPDNEALLGTLQWMLAPTDRAGNNPNPDLRPQVVNNSYGGPGGSLISESALAALRASGIVPVFAAGNAGGACGTMDSPGDNPSAFSVGATDSVDSIASFSSRGPNPFSGKAGPDVSAPGSSIPSSYPGDQGRVMSGTSMATPHVTGAVALILSAAPDLIGKVDQIEELLRATSKPLTTSEACGGLSGGQVPNNSFGHGRIDVAAAVGMVWQPGTLAGSVTDAATGLPIAGALVSITRNGFTLTQDTHATGAYTFVAGAGDYAVQVSAFGYDASAPTVLSMTQGQTITQNIQLAISGTATITGFVREVNAGPAVAGALVELVDASDGLTTTTSAGGVYALSGAPKGQHTLRVSAAGYETASTAISVAADTVQDFALAPTPDYQVGDGGDSCSAPFAWIDATGGAELILTDDAAEVVDLPAPFTYYGNVYSTVSISSNGFISFGARYTRWQGIIPFVGPPNNAIYGLSDDLDPASGNQGKIFTKSLPDGRFVVEYFQVEHWPSGDPETFEIILNPADNTIVLQYLQVSWPDFSSAGVENADGTRAVRYSYANVPPLRPGLAVKFTPFAGAPAPCQAFPVWLPRVMQ